MTIHELLQIVLRNKRFLIKTTVISAVILFFILFLIYPLTYEAEVTVLPPEQRDETSALSSLIGSGTFSGLLNFGFQSGNSQLFVEILKSRSASLYVVRKHNLTDYYGMSNDIETANYLSDKLNIDLTKEGIIKLNVEVTSALIPLIFDDRDSLKNLAALLSNSFVAALDSINKEKLTSKAKRARQYIERQIIKTKAVLDSVEFRLMTFQDENKTIAYSRRSHRQ